MKRVRPKTVDVSIATISTALVCAATMIFSIYIPATHGYYNIGESMVYATALLFGPWVGAFAGGIGSMFADILLGYPVYAPGTLAIKAAEGALVGYLSRKRPTRKLLWRAFVLIIAAMIGIFLAGVGASYLKELTLPPLVASLTLEVPAELWYGVGIVAFAVIAILGLRLDPEIGWTTFSILVGGFEMILGYILYEYVLYGPAFILEVPWNIGQVLVGLALSLPLVRAVQRAFPEIKSMYR